MARNIDLIQIMVDANHPDGNIFPLTYDVLYHPDVKPIGVRHSKYPFFTDDIEYPVDYLGKLQYDTIIQTFFNKSAFQDMLSQSTDNANVIDVSNPDKFYMERDRINNANIMIMLELLLPTGYPAKRDLNQTYDQIVGKKSFKPLFVLPFARNRYSYFKINGKPYTVSKVTWVNDFLNNPDYIKLLEKYNAFKNFIDGKLAEETKKLNAWASPTPAYVKNQFQKNIDLLNGVFVKPFSRTYFEPKTVAGNPDNTIGPDIKDEYNAFMFTFMNEYKLPRRESSNYELQKLINGSDDASATDFFKLLGNINERFLENKPSGNNIIEDLNLLKLGVNKIDTKLPDTEPRRQVTIFIEFIGGEITDMNKGELSCSYPDYRLSKQLKTWLRPKATNIKKILGGNAQSWKFMPDRTLFSISDASDKTNIVEQNDRAHQQQPNKRTEPLPAERMQPLPPNNDIELPNIKTWFSNNLLSIPGRQIEKALDEIKGVRNITNPLNNKDDIVNHINKNEKNLFEVLKTMSNAQTQYTREVDTILDRLKSHYTSETKIIEKDIAASKLSSKPLDELNYKNALNELYIIIVDQLIKIENAKPGALILPEKGIVLPPSAKRVPKPRVVSGGSVKKRRNNKQKNTRRKYKFR